MASENKVTLAFSGKRLGKAYHGFDNGIPFSVMANMTVSVSESTSRRLLSDFPSDFSVVGAPVAPVAPAVQAGSLDRSRRGK